MCIFFTHLPETRFEVTERAGLRDCSDVGRHAIGDVAECKEAGSQLGIGDGNDDGSWDNYPKGCGVWRNKVYWNSHEIGSGHKDVFLMCKKPGNYINWHCMKFFEIDI